MELDLALKELGILEGSLKPLEEGISLEAWGLKGEVLPYTFRPQLFSELETMLLGAQRLRLHLIPFGSFQGFHPGAPSGAPPYLLFQPGSCTLWRGVEKKNLFAPFPAALTLEEAEKLVNEEGFTLNLGLYDRGTIGGNWVLPRGSFLIFTFRHPAERMVGVTAILPDGTRLESRLVPRSAAGPNLARALMGMGAVRGFVVEATLRVSYLGEQRYGVARGSPMALLSRVRAVVHKGYHPHALALYAPSSQEAFLYLRHNLHNSWEERVWERLKEELSLVETTNLLIPEDHKPPRGWGCHRLLWSELFSRNFGEGSLFFSDPAPEGILIWHPPEREAWERGGLGILTLFPPHHREGGR